MFKGSDFILYILKNDNYLALDGLRVTKFTLSNQLIDISNYSNNNWRVIGEGVGSQSVSISVNGIFRNSEAEKYLSSITWQNVAACFKLSSASGVNISGKFFVSQFERLGNLGEEESYNFLLESSDIILISD